MLSVQLTVAYKPYRHRAEEEDGDRPGPTGESVPGATALPEMDPCVSLHLSREGYDLAASRDSERTAGTALQAH